MLDTIPADAEVIPDAEETMSWLREKRLKLACGLYRHEHPTRKHAFLMTEFLGHGSPSTGGANYHHCIEWLLHSFLQNSQRMRPTRQMIIRGSGVAPRTFARWTEGRSLMAAPVALWVRRTELNEAGAAPSGLESSLLPHSSEPSSVNPWIDRIRDLLVTADGPSAEFGSRVEKLGFTEREALRFWAVLATCANSNRSQVARGTASMSVFRTGALRKRQKSLCVPLLLATPRTSKSSDGSCRR